MNIARAKKEIINTAKAYLQKDADGSYIIPRVRQRPVLLMGPPGIGKTQIMEQIATECDLAFVSYTITHHTRQSAVGLPFIREKTYGGEVHSVTEYTMSEIISSVYDRMEESGKKEGILFIDEINCVSETLAPTMLQFLQAKTFGNQKVPEGWIICAAGNPPQYNKSVRSFDVVTLDRVKLINLEADYDAWRTYAYENDFHGSIMAYLDLHRENFYRMENTVDGRQFVTARGWEDLSHMIYAYERLGKELDREVAVQYLQHPATAKDFANYLSLYYKYRDDYRIDEILGGTIRSGALNKLKFAPFDERLEVTGLLLSALSGSFLKTRSKDEETEALYTALKEIGAKLENEQEHGKNHASVVMDMAEETENKAMERIAAGQKKEAADHFLRAAKTLKSYAAELEDHDGTGAEAFAVLRERFSEKREELEKQENATMQKLEYAFDFIEATFGEGQEMVVFITQLSVNPAAARFLREHDCPRYHMYNKQLLFADNEKDIHESLDAIREMTRS